MTQKKINLRESVISVFEYFKKYQYPITAEEIFVFLPQKAEKEEINNQLALLLDQREVTSKIVITQQTKEVRMARTKDKIDIKLFENRSRESQLKFEIAKKYIDLISKTQLFELIGVSGSVSMQNATDEHDIDLFAISKPKNLFLARFAALLIAELCGLRRRRLSRQVKNKICFNLLFDKADMCIPAFKRNLYTAHEVLQMKPVYVAGDCYKDFLEANKWVTDYFPNHDINQLSLLTRKNKSNTLPNSIYLLIIPLEKILKQVQIYVINRHKNDELITNTQLWFCDGEKKNDFT